LRDESLFVDISHGLVLKQKFAEAGAFIEIHFGNFKAEALRSRIGTSVRIGRVPEP
jgi:hypothetical protein